MIFSSIAFVAAETEAAKAALSRLESRYPHVPPE